MLRRILILITFLPFVFSSAVAQTADKKKALDELFKVYSAESGNILDIRILQNAFNREVVSRSIKILKKQDSLPGYGEGHIDVYEFSDYQCGYCRRMFPILQKYADLGRIRVHVIELPLLGPDSEKAAQYALAAHEQGKFALFHSNLMNNNNRPTIEIIKKMMVKANIDIVRAEKFVNNGEAGDGFDTSFSLATLLNVRGTPSMVINGEVFYGAITEEDFLLTIDTLQ